MTYLGHASLINFCTNMNLGKKCCLSIIKMGANMFTLSVRFLAHYFSFLYSIGKCQTCMRQSFNAAALGMICIAAFSLTRVYDSVGSYLWLIEAALICLWLTHVTVFSVRRCRIGDTDDDRRWLLARFAKAAISGAIMTAIPIRVFAQDCEWPDYYCSNQGLCCRSEEKCCEQNGRAYCNHWKNGGCSS